MISNSSHEEIKALLKGAGINIKFDAIVGGDEVKNGKPAPDELFFVEKMLNMDAIVCPLENEEPA